MEREKYLSRRERGDGLASLITELGIITWSREKRVCQKCGGEYTPAHKHSKYCSRRCARVVKWQKKCKK